MMGSLYYMPKKVKYCIGQVGIGQIISYIYINI